MSDETQIQIHQSNDPSYGLAGCLIFWFRIFKLSKLVKVAKLRELDNQTTVTLHHLLHVQTQISDRSLRSHSYPGGCSLVPRQWGRRDTSL